MTVPTISPHMLNIPVVSSPNGMLFLPGHIGGVGFDSFFADLADAGGAVGTENETEYL